MSAAEISLRGDSTARRLVRSLSTPGGFVYVVLFVVLVAIFFANATFYEPNRLMAFIARTTPIAIAAIGQYFVIVSGEFDLSMGAVIATQVAIASNYIGDDASRIAPALVMMIGIGLLVGLINGLVTTWLQVPSFIVTLGMLLALGGLVEYLTGGAATGNPVDEFRELGRGRFEDVPLIEILPYSVILLIVVAAAAALLMRSPFGRTLLAVGDNPEAARFAGTSVRWTKTRAFLLSSLAATLAGILLVGSAGVHPSVGSGYEFQAITAVVLGGVVLGGGRGWVLSAVAGAFTLELILSLMTLRDIPATWRETVQGVIIILAVAASARTWSLRRPGRGRLKPTQQPSTQQTSTHQSSTQADSARTGTTGGEQ